MKHYLFLILLLLNYLIPSYLAYGQGCSVSFGIKKDNRGFIWISTRLGIERYDGLYYKHYSLSEGDMRMADDGVRYDLLQNADGKIFVYSDLGKIFEYDEDADSFVQLHMVKNVLGGHSLHALAIEDNRLVLGLFDGISVLDRTTMRVSSQLCKGNNIRCIIPFENKTYLVGSQNGLWCLDVSKQSCDLVACPDLDIMSLYYDEKQRRIWMGTKGSGLWTLRLDNIEAVQIPNWEQAVVSSLCPYADSQLLVGTDGSGLLQTSRLYLSSLQLLASTTADAPNTLPSTAVQNVFVDGNNVWLATYDCGVILLSPQPQFGKLAHPDTKYVSDKHCYDIDRSPLDSTIWVAYNRYICHYEDVLSTPEVFLKDQSGFLAIEVASDGTVWCGGYNSGLYHLDGKTGKYSHIPSLNNAGVNSSIYDIIEDEKGNLWVGGHNFPLTCIKQQLGTDVSVLPKKEDMVQYDISRVEDIEPLNDSIVVVGAVNGFFLVNSVTGEIEHLLDENDHFEWEGTNFITCLITQDTHYIYIGTDGAGLLIYDTDQKQLKSYSTSSHQLPSNYIRALELSGDSLLWISTENRGVFSFDIKNEKVRHRFSDMQSDEFLMHSSVILPNGDILFGGKAGVELIYASTMTESNPNIKIYLSEVGIGQEKRISYLTHPKILDAPLFSTKKIRLPYGEKSLSLHFTTDDLYHQNDHLLVYMLDNESDWEKMNSQRELNFFTLPVGNHTLRVRCIMSNGNYVEEVFEINSQQTFWLSWYALLVYFVILVALVTIIVFAYVKRKEDVVVEKRVNEYLREFEAKQKAATKETAANVGEKSQQEQDEKFVKQLMSIIEKYIARPDLSIDDLAREMAMSHTLFYNKIRQIYSLPPANLIRNCRMKHAKELLETGEHSISEVAMMCGFSDAKYFSTVFKKFYGVSPSKINES